MKLNLISKRLAQHQEGATIIEFAIVAPIFFLLIMGIIEFGLLLFHQAVIEAVTMQVSRVALVGKVNPGCDRVCTVQRMVTEKGGKLMKGDKIIVSANPVAAGGTAKPDICIVNGVPDSTVPTCTSPDLLQEINGIPGYQGAGSLTLGNAGELVEVRISYPYKLLTPGVGRFFGNNGVVLISASTVIQNEPFGGGP